MSSSNPCSQFADAVYRDTGAVIEPIPDGKVHRFDDPEGRQGNLAGWYVLHLDGHPAGAYGSWRSGYQGTWRLDCDQKPAPAEKARVQASWKAARERRERELAKAQAQAAKRAKSRWESAQPATVEHPYLARKQIPALGLRQQGPLLLVPLLTVDGDLVNVQQIYADGSKRFLKGGRITGCFALVGRQIPETGTVYVCEGWATAMTIHVKTRATVVAAMSAVNLKPVAQALRKLRPGLDLILAADYDHRTPGNPGMRHATEAARAVGGGVISPLVCGGENCLCVDFNDLAVCDRRAAQ